MKLSLIWLISLVDKLSALFTTTEQKETMLNSMQSERILRVIKRNNVPMLLELKTHHS